MLEKINTALADARRQAAPKNLPTNISEQIQARTAALATMTYIVAKCEKDGRRPLTETETSEFDEAQATVQVLTPQIDAKMGPGSVAFQAREYAAHANDPNWKLPKRVSEAHAERVMEQVNDYIRHGIMATDSPLFSGGGPTAGSGLGAAIPLDVLGALRTYYQLNSFELAGATVIGTDNTIPLVKPIIGAGAAASAFSEGASSTDSNPFSADSFTFGADKYSRLVKVSNESLMNVAYDLNTEITAELMAGLANSQTAVYSAALVAALEGNASTYVAPGADKLSTLLGVLANGPVRVALPDNKWMLSRANLKLIRDQRDGFERPLIPTTDTQILGFDFVLNDNLTRNIVFGSWKNGAFIRKTGMYVQRLLEAYASAGEVGIRATQFSQAKFIASVGSVTVDPLSHCTFDGEGS